MPAITLGEMQLAWEFGPGFAHACSHFKNPERGPRSSFVARLREIAKQLEDGKLNEETAAHHVTAATAAFVYHLEKAATTITVTAAAVTDDEPPEADQEGGD